VSASIDDTTLTITGDGANDTIAISVSADMTHLDVNTDGADLSFDRSEFDQVEVDAGGGNDTVGVTGDTTGDAFSIHGGAGNDFIDGSRGDDQLFGDEGDDTFTWAPGEASDTIEGDDGADRLVMAGGNVNEKFE